MFLADVEEGDYRITLDFLGKDSMRYFQTIDLNRYGHVGHLVYNNIRKFCEGKSPDNDIFDQLSVSVNRLSRICWACYAACKGWSAHRVSHVFLSQPHSHQS